MEERRGVLKLLGEIVHTDIEGPFEADVVGSNHFQVSVEVKTRDAVVEATIPFVDDDMVRERIAVTFISGDGTGKLGRSVRFEGC